MLVLLLLQQAVDDEATESEVIPSQSLLQIVPTSLGQLRRSTFVMYGYLHSPCLLRVVDILRVPFALLMQGDGQGTSRWKGNKKVVAALYLPVF